MQWLDIYAYIYDIYCDIFSFSFTMASSYFIFGYYFILFFIVLWVDPNLSFKQYVCGCRSIVKLCPWVCPATCLCSWWRHQMETFSASQAICAGNSPVPGDFPPQRPVTRSFDVFFDLCLNKRLSKQSWGWWFEMLLCPLWRHCNTVPCQWRT